MVRIILADDHRRFRGSLKMFLIQRPGFVVVGEVGNGLELVKLLKQGDVADLLIVDLSMPDLGGIEAIRKIRETDLIIRVLMLTMHQEEDFVCQAFLVGADGYLLKEDTAKELHKAVDTVLRDRVYVSTFFAKGLQDKCIHCSQGHTCRGNAFAAGN